MDKFRRFQQALNGAGVQPGKATSHKLHVQPPLFQIHFIQSGDFQLPPDGGLHLLGLFRHALGVKVQAGNGVIALWVGGLLLHGDDPVVFVKLHHAETLGVGHIVAEHGSSSVFGGVPRAGEDVGKTVAVEDIVAQYHGAGIVPDKFLANQKRLCQPIGRRLNGILQTDAKMAAVPQQILKPRGIRRGRNDQNIPNSGKHQGGQRIVDHGLVINGKQLFGGDLCQRIKPCAGSTG